MLLAHALLGALKSTVSRFFHSVRLADVWVVVVDARRLNGLNAPVHWQPRSHFVRHGPGLVASLFSCTLARLMYGAVECLEGRRVNLEHEGAAMCLVGRVLLCLHGRPSRFFHLHLVLLNVLQLEAESVGVRVPARLLCQ